jgi:hypothetical protein
MECRVQLQLKLLLYSASLNNVESKKGANDVVRGMDSGWESYREDVEEAIKGKGETEEEKKMRRIMEEEQEEGEIDE